jgi:hypothetical protein
MARHTVNVAREANWKVYVDGGPGDREGQRPFRCLALLEKELDSTLSS